jgi:hypothetical protein
MNLLPLRRPTFEYDAKRILMVKKYFWFDLTIQI